jgi:hypothetical protein
MDLLERYLQAVGKYLPAKGKEDTLAELRANLLAQMEDKAEALGRPLTEQEEAEVLRGHGHPSVVAERYRPKRQLIGPEIFPYYWLTMSRALPFVIAITVVSRAVELVYGPPQTHIVVTSIARLFSVLFYFFGWMTLAFAAIEFFHLRYPQKVTLHADWDPRKLAKIEPKEKSDLPKHPVADLIFSALFTAWLLAFPRYPYLLFGPGAWYLSSISLDLAPVWHRFYWAVVVLNCVQLIFKSIALFRQVQPWRKPMKIVEQIFGLSILFLLLRVRDYVVYVSPITDPSRLHFAETLNMVIHQGLEVVAVIASVKLLWDIGQMIMGLRANRAGHVALI